jgi:redox-sensitive bicupin YhaK (pirin superfamily)
MMVRKSNERGFFDHGWLKSYHTFSFADYFDSNFMGFGHLRVINDDIVDANTGFPMHPHKNMEIITYILEGSLTHSDNIGNKEDINTGQVQIMSAGRGIVHSEWNNGNKPCHLLQIWIKTNNLNTEPSYKIYTPDHLEKWALIASGDEGDKTFHIQQDAKIYVIDSGSLSNILIPDMSGNIWIHVATGNAKVMNVELSNGDAIGLHNKKIKGEKIEFYQKSKVLVFCV